MIDRAVPVRAVFFDAGETLVHPYPSFPELLTSILRREGFDIDQGVLTDRIHVVAEHFTKAARDGDLWTTSPERSRAFWTEVYRAFLAEVGLPFPDELGQVLYREFTDLSNYRAFPDVLPALERLRAAGLILGVISNFEEWLERLLEHLEVAGYFDVAVISGIAGVEKPDPRIFRLALDGAGVGPAESVYVGDNPTFDTAPAEALGMTGVLLDRRNRFPDHPGNRIATLDDLDAVIGLRAARSRP